MYVYFADVKKKKSIQVKEEEQTIVDTYSLKRVSFFFQSGKVNYSGKVKVNFATGGIRIPV